MRGDKPKSLLVEGWAFVGVAAIAFVAGLLIGDLGGSTKTETVTLAGASSESEEPGAQVFANNGCGSCHTFKAAESTGTIGPNLNEYLAPDDEQAGIEEMILDPNSEIAEGYKPNIMPQTYSQEIPKPELEQLVEFLVENSPAAGGGKPEGPGGEEHDAGGPTN